MLRTLKLLLPAILPSWRFFDFIAPSPRVQFTLLTSEYGLPQEWRDFRPRPQNLSFPKMLARMLWNPTWNESLFVVSCAERLLEKPTTHSESQILDRIMRDLGGASEDPQLLSATHLQFRLLLVQRQGAELKQTVAYQSRIQALLPLDTSREAS